MGTIIYGQSTFHMDDEVVVVIRKLIREIIAAGDTHWVPLTGTNDAGDHVTIDMLVTPGVPIVTNVGHDETSNADMERLLEKYVPVDDEKPAEV